MLMAVGSRIVVLSISLVLSRSIALALAATAYFISEKVADELLRFRLFEKRFVTWGWSNIAKSVLQMVAFLLMLFQGGHAMSLWLPVLAFSAATLLVFVPQLPFALCASAAPVISTPSPGSVAAPCRY